MDASALHEDAIVIDGLVISKWGPSVFQAMRAGGLTAANCTCSVWEGCRETMENIARWKKWFHEYDDLLIPVHHTSDIEEAKRSKRTGIILGWQNTSALEDRADFVEIFRDLGVRVMQLTYNTANLVGSGCWESHDGGLTDFGRDVIDEMNRCGVLVDLSHVGPVTGEDALRHSARPVSFTHCCPAGIKDHPRNKSDAQMRAVAERGGFIGIATYPPFLPWGDDTTVDHCVEVMEYAINVVGEDAVGVGTDFTEDQDLAFFEWLRRDKGVGRLLVPGTPRVPRLPEGLARLNEFPSLTAAMMRRGWGEDRIRKVLGGNWLRFLADAWGE
ncbi:dipeptidase [Thioalkalivibrio sp. HK1]|uniref:dipeptidase n=1 Tax=Thioalkalivibrio sp. HK1 TaxID=1469245 RepID=UPI0004723999|nr:membrane dipeptidase [Thioalkalivibrio sp. HK1]